MNEKELNYSTEANKQNSLKTFFSSYRMEPRQRFYALCASVVISLLFLSAVRAADWDNVLGVTHVDGKYFLTHDEDFLNEGADQILAVGTTTIKLYLNPTSVSRYPWNSHWPADIHSIVELAKTPYFKKVFAKPFKTYILTTYSFGRPDQYWVMSWTAADEARETHQFHDLAKYFLTTYNGTGKTFVLQNWEGDWSLRADDQNHIYDAKFTPTPMAIHNMIRWFNARQAGILQARQEVPNTDVHVYQAAESNRVVDSMAGRPGVANSVLPYTTVDFASYSSWDAQNTHGGLAKAIDYLAAHLPPTAAFGQNTHSVYIGEYGAPENGLGAQKVNDHINNTLAVVREKQLPWAIYWEIYCNELQKGFTAPCNGNDKAPKGFWLIKPDGTPGTAWHRYRQLLATANPNLATSDAIKSRSQLFFTEDFARPDGPDLGPEWSTAHHYGEVEERLANHHLQMTIPSGDKIPWGSATLKLPDAMHPGDYFEFTLQRFSPAGSLGVELFDSDQLRQGAATAPGSSSLEAWNGVTWVPISVDASGDFTQFDWNHPHVLGVHFTSADGHFATFAYYLDGNYIASWIIRTGNKSLNKIGFYSQSERDHAKFEFSHLQVFRSAR